MEVHLAPDDLQVQEWLPAPPVLMKGDTVQEVDIDPPSQQVGDMGLENMVLGGVLFEVHLPVRHVLSKRG